MNNTTLENWKALKPSSFKTVNHVLAPDYRLLKESLEKFGWLVPIVVRKEDSTIIDGYHRWVLAANDPKALGEEIPVSWVSCDQVDAMVLHVVLNRSKGSILNRDLSVLLKQIQRSKKYEEEELRLLFRMSHDEFDILRDGTLLKHKNIKRHEYSKAWVPIETSGTSEPIKIERPPNEDS